MSPAAQDGLLTIGIVTHNNAAFIESTVKSVLANLPRGPKSKIIILDNLSTDDTPKIIGGLAAKDDRITVYVNDRNVGFGGGHNRILREVESTYHVLCNPDIALTPSALHTLIRFLDERPDVAIASPRVHFEDGRLQPSNRLHPTVWDLFLRRFLPKSLRSFFQGRMDRYEMLDVGYERECDVPFVSGAFMIFRTEILKMVGGFDERYFLYFEDADLSREIQRRGFRTAYCPGALVIHGWQRDAHKSLRSALTLLMSAIRYFNKWGWTFF